MFNIRGQGPSSVVTFAVSPSLYVVSLAVGLGELLLVVATGSRLLLVLLTVGAAGSLLHAVSARSKPAASVVIVGLHIKPACRIAHKQWQGVIIS
ncbi:hypothetical protein [Streptomyces halstedii]|uniref:Uncharacterized protein n=1 Tax=Streptomyces halstedii TaxID=1944 RepID=A0A6N9U4H7_STRHA|nr:hypothetical protein [Streptomyces halstedii]NEA18744.1 hypothetical protein [Streptomyces halstedii]